MSKTMAYIIAEANKQGLTADEYLRRAHEELRFQEAEAVYFDSLDVPKPDEERADYGEGE